MRIQNTEYRIQNTECRAFSDIRSTLELTPARGKGWTADAVGLQAAQTYDHESGEPQERFRIEPSISGTHSGCAHRLDRATQSVTGHWRGEVIEANENRSTSIQDAHELPCTNALSVHIPTHATHRHTACQQPPPCLVSLACLRLRSSVRSRQVAIICFSISAFALARPRRSILLARD